MSYSRRPVLELGVVDFGVETVELPNGLTVELAVVRHPGASAVIAIDEANRIVMLSQWRHAVGGYLWEIPAGCRREDESAADCARRELREETGLVASTWHHLGTIVTVPSFSDERIDIFLAGDLIEGEREPDPDEIIKVSWFELDRALDMITTGEIVDAKTISAIHYLLAHLGRR
jgi:ADP-ribose pyrophosphatase